MMCPLPLERTPSVGCHAGPSPPAPPAASTLSLAPGSKIGSPALDDAGLISSAAIAIDKKERITRLSWMKWMATAILTRRPWPFKEIPVPQVSATVSPACTLARLFGVATHSHRGPPRVVTVQPALRLLAVTRLCARADTGEGPSRGRGWRDEHESDAGPRGGPDR